MLNKTDLFLEDSIVDNIGRDLEVVEMPLSKKAFNLVIFFTFLVAGAVFGRIAFLDIKNGNFYEKRALANMSEMTIIPAERGIFFDRFNNDLVKNIPSFKVSLKATDFLKKDFSTQAGKVKEVEEILNLENGQIRKWLADFDLEKQSIITLAKDLTIEQTAQLKNLDYNWLSVESDFKRQYEGSGTFSHVLGYVGLVSKKDLEESEKFLLNDIIGKAGLELYYDEILRGSSGELYEYKNAKNESLGQNSSIAAVKGNNLYLTIDAEFQKYFYQRLQEQLKSLGRNSGVGIAINPQNGEILALLNIPSFDNNKISKDDLINPSRPLFNRAVSGVYNPGSTIKPLVAAASLAEGVVDTTKSIFSKGYIEIPNPYFPDNPSRFVDWKPHGWVNLYSALARSSNIYFYTVGGGFEDIKGLGIEKLREYWKKFGLDQKTGIDLPNEKFGFLPDVEEKEKRTGTPWRLGDTYNVSIGQGDLMITPIELLNYITAIANQGKLYKPYVVKKEVDNDGRTVKENSAKIIFDLVDIAPYLKEVEKGMVDGSQKEYGTSYLLHDLPFKTAAKTGSAQIEMNQKVNAFFVGYAPVPNPQIALLVLVENARDGSSNTIPVARDVLKWYYEHRIKSL